MYILKVVLKSGAHRFAYGSEAAAIEAMRRWKNCPGLVKAEIVPIDARYKEMAEATAR